MGVLIPDYRYDSVPMFLVDFGCVEHGEAYVLRSGRSSDVYVNLRGIPSHPASMRYMARHIKSSIEEKFNHVEIGFLAASGAAVPLAALASAEYLDVPFVWVRSDVKDHGDRRRVEWYGRDLGGGIIFDDVLTSGSSIEYTNDALQEVGLHSTRALVVVDRRLSKDRKRVAGLITRSMCTMGDLLKIERNHDTRGNGRFRVGEMPPQTALPRVL